MQPGRQKSGKRAKLPWWLIVMFVMGGMFIAVDRAVNWASMELIRLGHTK